MVQEQRLRPLVEGSLLAAITAVFGIISLNIPLLSFFTDFLWGIPIVVVFIRHDWRIGLMSLAVAGSLTLMFTEPVRAGLLLLQLGPVAVVYGLMFRRKLPAGRILLTGVVVTVIAEAVVLGLFLYFQRNVYHFGDEINRQAQEAIEFYKKAGLLEMYAKQGYDEAAVRQLIENTIKLTKLLLPGTFIIAAAIKAVLTYIVSARVLERLGFGRFRLPPFSEWSLPWYASWVVMVGILLTLGGDYFTIPVLAAIGKNIVFICFPIFFIIGLAVCVHFFRRGALPGWVKVLLAVIALINLSGAIIFVTIIGIFDPLISFRKQGKNQDS